jgi:hypothetical protein
MAARGSSKLVRDQALTKKDVDRLLKVLDADDSAALVHWWLKGTPNPEWVTGIVKAKHDAAGELIGKILGLKSPHLKLEVFPLGIPVPDEVLIQIEHGGPQV